MGSRAVAHDVGAVRGGAGGMRGAVDLADGAASEAVGLAADENHFRYLFLVPLANYLRAGVLGPALYLGTVLSPLAILQLATPRWRRVVMGAAGIFASALILMWMDTQLPVTPEYSCFGGWHNVLILRGGPNRFSWDERLAIRVPDAGERRRGGIDRRVRGNFQNAGRRGRGDSDAAMVYWAATIPLWFYNDRYYLVLVPPARSCLRSRRCREAGWCRRRHLR